MNSLIGALVRFRRERVGVMCDIEQMFYSFYVNPEHRNYLRFLWFQDNDPKKAVIEYRMNVHLFGNGPNPAVATFGLRKTALDTAEEYGLASRPTAEEAVELIANAQNALATSNLKLQKLYLILWTLWKRFQRRTELKVCVT